LDNTPRENEVGHVGDFYEGERGRFFCARFAALRPVELKSARREQLRASLRRKELFLFARDSDSRHIISQKVPEEAASIKGSV
jgi:hypothetical protein